MTWQQAMVRVRKEYPDCFPVFLFKDNNWYILTPSENWDKQFELGHGPTAKEAWINAADSL